MRRTTRRYVFPTVLCAVFALTGLLASFFLSCDGWEAAEPEYFEVVELSGTPYERGYQHGVQMESKIQSLYTMLLTNSIFPYLNRERNALSSVMIRYQDEEIYGNRKFAKTMMTESAWSLYDSIPDIYLEEMRGVADGSGMSFEEILVMNTFFDTLMGFRSLTFYIKLIQGPWIDSMEMVGIGSDGIDNNGDGVADDAGEVQPIAFEPRFDATWVEVPTDATLRLVLIDGNYGADPDSVRIQLNENIYTASHESIQTRVLESDSRAVEVTFSPPGGLDPASVYYVNLQATDLQKTTETPPASPRSMRDERFAFTTVGYGARPHEVPNRGMEDGRSQAPSLGFAVRGTATNNDRLYVAHHFALLDSDITHKHATLFIHHTDQGKTFGTVGYPGVIGGFSGMNADGVTFLYNTSDTLNNSFTQGFTEGLVLAKLQPAGMPISIMGREILETADSIDPAMDYLKNTQPTFGWNLLLADRSGRFEAVELDGNFTERPSGGFYSYNADAADPENQDMWGRPIASVGPDDLRIISHYEKNLNEISFQLITFNIQPQRYWSSFFFRSLKAFYVLGEQIDEHYGQFDLATVAKVMRDPELVDERDSMFAVIFEPETLTMNVAAGHVPATDGQFRRYDIGQMAKDWEAK